MPFLSSGTLLKFGVELVNGESLYMNVMYWSLCRLAVDRCRCCEVLARGWTCVELLASLDAKTDEFPSQEDLSGAAMALLRLQDTYALSTKHLAAGNVQGISDSMSMSGMFCYS